MADDRLLAAIEAIREQVAELSAEIADAKRTANSLAKRAGLAPIYNDADAPAATASLAIRADAFANFSAPSTAARAFLEARGQTVGSATVEQILDALKRGGFAFGPGIDPENALRIALGKDALVRRLPNGTFGLEAWYPQARKERDETTGKKKGAKANGDAAEEKAAVTDDFPTSAKEGPASEG